MFTRINIVLQLNPVPRTHWLLLLRIICMSKKYDRLILNLTADRALLDLCRDGKA